MLPQALHVLQVGAHLATCTGAIPGCDRAKDVAVGSKCDRRPARKAERFPADLHQRVADRIGGRFLVLFPGSYERGNYRLLDARDGWNYLAIPITIPEGATR